MELLVYVRNHSPGKTYVGVSVGEEPRAEYLASEAPLESFAEFRLRLDGIHPIIELERIVREAVISAPAFDKEVSYRTSRASVNVRFGPGFETPEQICAPMVELLAHCAVPQVAMPMPRAQA